MKLDIGGELETLGLSQHEAKVYLTSIRTGATTAQALASKSGITRPTTYINVESLIRKGLMSSYIKGNKKFYAAADPNTLTYIVNGLQREAEAKEEAVGKIVDALGKMVAEEQSATTVRVLEGVDATNEVLKDIAESGASKVLELVSVDEARKWVPPMQKGDLRGKLMAKINWMTLYTHSLGEVVDQSIVAGSKAKSKFMDGGKHPVVGAVTVYADRAVFSSYTPKHTSVIMRDRGIAETMNTLFTSLWDNA